MRFKVRSKVNFTCHYECFKLIVKACKANAVEMQAEFYIIVA